MPFLVNFAAGVAVVLSLSCCLCTVWPLHTCDGVPVYHFRLPFALECCQRAAAGRVMSGRCLARSLPAVQPVVALGQWSQPEEAGQQACMLEVSIQNSGMNEISVECPLITLLELLMLRHCISPIELHVKHSTVKVSMCQPAVRAVSLHFPVFTYRYIPVHKLNSALKALERIRQCGTACGCCIQCYGQRRRSHINAPSKTLQRHEGYTHFTYKQQ